MVRYRDIAGDGGSGIADQLQALQKRLAHRLVDIGQVLLVMSGKGGVGKSSVTVNLAAGFASKGLRVGVLDGDVYGASVPKMLGLAQPDIDWQATGVVPPKGPLEMPVMALEFLLKEQVQPVAWDGPVHEGFTYRGNLEFHALREMLADTLWGELDLLIIDLPPGTSQTATLCGLLPKLAGILMVSMPTAVAQLVVNRALTMVTQVLNAPVLGVVENMCGYVHTETGAILPLFPEATSAYGGTEVLGRLPFDHRMAEACDQGVPFVTKFPDSPTAEAFFQLQKRLAAMIFQETEV